METLVPVGYAEHTPPPDLLSQVVCFWTSLTPDGVAESPARRVLPDGCVDIVLAFGAVGDPATTELREAFAVGAMTKPLVVEGPGPRLYIGVRFKPGFAFAAFGIPASELTDDRVSYELLVRDGGDQLARVVREETNEGRLLAMIALVRQRLFGAAAVPRS
ncbi:MAG TPA: DUF6597 domain-containing transcriptional factor, partial [Gemmatimonadaceae bacterium]